MPGPALHALHQLLASTEAVRNGRALWLLLAVFACTGLLLAMAGAALARGEPGWGMLQTGLALAAAFHGGNAAGVLLMDQARGHPLRDVPAALRAAWPAGLRLLVVLLLALALLAALAAALGALLWLARADVLGPRAGPLLFALTVPLGVLGLGAGLLALATVVAPLAAPALWAGLGLRSTLRLAAQALRQRALFVAVLVAGAALLASTVGALLAAAVLAAGQVVAAGAVLVTEVDLPPQQLMAGLFGYGPRGLGAVGAPVARSAHGVAALAGGGVVFVLALVLPALVYMRALCGVLLVLRPDLVAPPPPS